ncbi:MAG: rare lipoprotein A [Candidatus Azotimanducaceae bacterium]
MKRLVCVVVLLSLLVGCATQTPSKSGRYDQDQDAAPALSPAAIEQLANLENPQVVDLSPSARGNPATYNVWGNDYAVLPSSEGYLEEGNASWYGTKFHGRSTSSGEPFDMFTLTAAHRSLPIPVFARVTNLANGKDTIVRINDRGPFHSDRIIDLSFAAAVKLGFHESGTARVRVETVSYSTEQVLLEVGDFVSLSDAQLAKGQLSATSGAVVEVVKIIGGEMYRLQVGPLSNGAPIERIKALVATLGLGRVNERTAD